MGWYEDIKQEFCGHGYNERFAPRRFLEELRLYDPRLLARWDNANERWQIGIALGRKVEGRRFLHLFHVENEDGSYCPLDRRVFWALNQMDTWRGEGIKAWQREYLEEQANLKAKEKADLKALQADMGRSYARYIKNRPERERIF